MVLVSGEMAKRKFRPLFYEEHEYLGNEIYKFVNLNDRLPKIEELSKTSRDIVLSSNGIEYNAENGLRFTCDKPYPVNVPISALLTCGLVDWPKGFVSCGSIQSPEQIKRNAALGDF